MIYGVSPSIQQEQMNTQGEEIINYRFLSVFKDIWIFVIYEFTKKNIKINNWEINSNLEL